MTNRPLIRPNLPEFRDRPFSRQRPKETPPESTSAEAFYYVKQIQSRTPVVVVLLDGEQLDGVIEWYDRGCIMLNREQAPDVFLMKHAIRYIYKRPDGTGHKPRSDG